MQTQRPDRIHGIDYIEIYVANCHQAAHYYRTVLGFLPVAEGILHGEAPDRRSIAMQRNNIHLLLTAPLSASGDVAEHIQRHGEGIKDIALCVEDVEQLITRAVAAGAAERVAPCVWESFRMARVGAYGDLVHSLIERPYGSTWRLPGLLPCKTELTAPDTGLLEIDHLAMAVPEGELDRQADFYTRALGFEETHKEDVSTEYSGMRSKVVQTPGGQVRFPIMEPTKGRRRSQIDKYIDAHHGPGVQHLAFCSENIVRSASMLAAALELLPTPEAYYESLEKRVGSLAGELPSLRRFGILADRDAHGLLLQVFTKPIGTRPTLFLELIERRGAEGFGAGNIKALFDAVERAEETAVLPS